MKPDPAIQLALVAIIAILAVLYMYILFNRVPAPQVYPSAGAAYTAPGGSVSADDSLLQREIQQGQLAQALSEANPQVKLEKAKSMSGFVQAKQ